MYKFRTNSAPGKWNSRISRQCDCLFCQDAFHAIESLWIDVEAQRNGNRNVPSWWWQKNGNRMHTWKNLHMDLRDPSHLVPRITDAGTDRGEITQHAQTRWGDE